MLDITGYNQESMLENPELTVNYTCLGSCPEGVKTAIKNMIREAYDNRSDAKLSENAYAMLLPYKIYR
jgi:hypothetical protein